jgi:uncharacterized protein
MLSSILKYFDIARLVGAGIKCPMCNSTRCQQSKWHSKHEKMSSASNRPYRCLDCTYRFLATRGAALEPPVINGAAAVLLILGALTVAELWQEAESRQLKIVSTVQPGEGPAGGEVQRLAANAATDAGKAPEALGNKLQTAAENGDPAAMLELGRDLATGNSRPKDVGQAAKWVQLAAATGNPDAMLELGRFYRDGLGVAQDSSRAYVWLSRAAAAKNTHAVLEREALVRTMGEAPLKTAQDLSLPTQPAAALIRPK